MTKSTALLRSFKILLVKITSFSLIILTGMELFGETLDKSRELLSETRHTRFSLQKRFTNFVQKIANSSKCVLMAYADYNKIWLSFNNWIQSAKDHVAGQPWTGILAKSRIWYWHWGPTYFQVKNKLTK